MAEASPATPTMPEVVRAALLLFGGMQLTVVLQFLLHFGVQQVGIGMLSNFSNFSCI
jgi:hypothetical protein